MRFKKQGEAAATLFTGKHSEMTARMLGETGHDRAGLYCMSNNVYQSFSGVSLSDGEKITATKTQRSHAVIFNQIVAFVAVAVEWMSDEELNRFLTKRVLEQAIKDLQIDLTCDVAIKARDMIETASNRVSLWVSLRSISGE